MSMETRRGCQIPWRWSDRQLQAAWGDAGNLAWVVGQGSMCSQPPAMSPPAPLFQEVLACLISTSFWKIEKAPPTEVPSLK